MINVLSGVHIRALNYVNSMISDDTSLNKINNAHIIVFADGNTFYLDAHLKMRPLISSKVIMKPSLF